MANSTRTSLKPLARAVRTYLAISSMKMVHTARAATMPHHAHQHRQQDERQRRCRRQPEIAAASQRSNEILPA